MKHYTFKMHNFRPGEKLWLQNAVSESDQHRLAHQRQVMLTINYLCWHHRVEFVAFLPVPLVILALSTRQFTPDASKTT